jgi:HD-GYP domain-containing protein (c-di-GMP phosphodiesterase class II)
MTGQAISGVRLAELVASLSLATDLGLGQPQGHILRTTVIATRLAALAGLPEDEQAAAFYVALLAWVGCVADSHELARWFGDDTRIRAASYEVNRAGLPMLRFLLANLATDGSSVRRISATGQFMASGFREVMQSMSAHCETTGEIAEQLGLAPAVQRSLPQALERWDGKGGPIGLAGEQIERVMRVVHIAQETEVLCRIGGMAAAVRMLREREGREFDPRLAELCRTRVAEILGNIETVDAWGTVIHGCAPLDQDIDEAGLRAALRTFADYADLKSPWFLGHSRATAALAAQAARRMGLGAAAVDLAEHAGLVCRLGGIGVSAATWARPGPLSGIEWERVRAVPYLTERVLSHQPRLAEIGTIASMLYERADGSGYPRGISGSAIPLPARVLAAAQMYQALREERPHRGALGPAQARAVLLGKADAGRLDAAAVSAVLTAAGHQPRRRANLIAGLSPREVEVLGLLVRGLSNKQIAAQLFVSARTVGTHIEHIYLKIGVSSRGPAAMYAMRHGLVDPSIEGAPEPQRSGD